MNIFGCSIMGILFLAVCSGLLLKLSDKTSEKYQNKCLRTIILKINQVCSCIILIPIQIAFGFFLALIVLWVLLILAEKVLPPNLITLLLTFSFWFLSMQFFMRPLWKLCKYVINRINDHLKLPEIISSFIGYLFYGKVFIYILASVFVITKYVPIQIPFFDDELKKIVEASVLIFIAVDQVIIAIQNWFKTYQKQDYLSAAISRKGK